MKAKAPESFSTLDGMRGFGALLVVITHMQMFWGGLEFPGAIVVDMFFMLSGFVVAYVYEPRFAKGLNTGKFMLQRFVRLYPMYIVGVLMGAALFFASALHEGIAPDILGERLVQFGVQLLMLPAPDFANLADGHDLYVFDVPAWSLFFELCINFAYILILPVLKTRVLIGIVVLGAIELVASAFAFGSLDVGPEWPNIIGGFARVTFAYFCGVLIYRLAGRPSTPTKRTSWWALLSVGLVPLLCWAHPSPAIRPIYDLVAVLLILPATIWFSHRVQTPKVFDGLFTFLRRISYVVFAIHFPIYELFRHISWRRPEMTTTWAPYVGIALLAVVIVAATLVERFYDAPLRTAVRRWLKNRSEQIPAAAAAAATAAAAAAAPVVAIVAAPIAAAAPAPLVEAAD